MDGETTFVKQKDGETLEAKSIHSGYEQLMKLYSQGKDHFLLRPGPAHDPELQKVTLTLQARCVNGAEYFSFKRPRDVSPPMADRSLADLLHLRDRLQEPVRRHEEGHQPHNVTV